MSARMRMSFRNNSCQSKCWNQYWSNFTISKVGTTTFYTYQPVAFSRKLWIKLEWNNLSVRSYIHLKITFGDSKHKHRWILEIPQQKWRKVPWQGVRSKWKKTSGKKKKNPKRKGSKKIFTSPTTSGAPPCRQHWKLALPECKEILPPPTLLVHHRCCRDAAGQPTEKRGKKKIEIQKKKKKINQSINQYLNTNKLNVVYYDSHPLMIAYINTDIKML